MGLRDAEQSPGGMCSRYQTHYPLYCLQVFVSRTHVLSFLLTFNRINAVTLPQNKHVEQQEDLSLRHGLDLRSLLGVCVNNGKSASLREERTSSQQETNYISEDSSCSAQV